MEVDLKLEEGKWGAHSFIGTTPTQTYQDINFTVKVAVGAPRGGHIPDPPNEIRVEFLIEGDEITWPEIPFQMVYFRVVIDSLLDKKIIMPLNEKTKLHGKGNKYKKSLMGQLSSEECKLFYYDQSPGPHVSVGEDFTSCATIKLIADFISKEPNNFLKIYKAVCDYDEINGWEIEINKDPNEAIEPIENIILKGTFDNISVDIKLAKKVVDLKATSIVNFLFFDKIKGKEINWQDNSCKRFYLEKKDFPADWKLNNEGKLKNSNKLNFEFTILHENYNFSDEVKKELRMGLPLPLNEGWGLIVSNLFHSKVGSDLTVICDGKEFLAHKLILKAISPVFETMFSIEMKENLENIFKIEDASPEAVLELLRFIYTRQIQNYEEHAFELFNMGRKYEIKELEQISWAIILKNNSQEEISNLILI